jgi:RHS repeat-associated protein
VLELHKLPSQNRIITAVTAVMFLLSTVSPQLVYARTVQSAIPPRAVPSHVKTGPRSVKIIKPKLSFSSSPTDLELTTSRVFLEPLRPMHGAKVEGENQALASALTAYQAQADRSDLTVLTKFLTAYPASRWVPSLQLNIAEIQYENGYVSKAMQNWQSVWTQTKESSVRKEKEVADESIGRLLIATGRLGHTDELKKLLGDVSHRKFDGTNELRVKQAQQGVFCQTKLPKRSFKCGPFAINSILNIGKKNPALNPEVYKMPATTNGTNIAQVKELADKVGLHYQIAKRSAGAPLVVPAVMHWRLGHFSAITAKRGERYQITDPTFDVSGNMWVKAGAVDAESDGYFLVPNGALPSGWSSVSVDEAAKVWGRGFVGPNSQGKGCSDPTTGCPSCQAGGRGASTGSSGGPSGMAVARAFLLQASLTIQDTPLKYSVPVGPSMQFVVNYNHNEGMQPSEFTFPNFGTNWSMNWCAYLTLDSSQNATVRMPGGGYEQFQYTVPDNIQNPYLPDLMSQAILTVPSAGIYQRQLPDGSMQVFNQPDGAGHIFMSQVVDSQGNSVYIQYDENFRIVGVTDSIGEVSTITYVSNTVGDAGFFKVSQISDPFGRFASFGYDPTGTYLVSITDQVGITSQFAYDPNDSTSFINRMTTPYGTTSFAQLQIPSFFVTLTTLQTFYPDGTSSVVMNGNGEGTFTYYWNREVFGLYPTEYLNPLNTNHAQQTGWMVLPVNPYDPVPVPQYFFVLDSDQTTYTYPGQSTTPDDAYATIGGICLPQTVTLGSGTSTYQYNAAGKVTNSIDQIGRTFSYRYAANNIDLLEQRQTRNGANDLLGKWVYNNTQHLPNKYVDGSGQVTQYSYNKFGQQTTLTDALGNVSTRSYNANGFLTQVNGPLPGNADVTTYQYDGYNRLCCVSDSEGFTVYFSYDQGDRLVQTLYPDGTTEQNTYSNLDVILQKDRLNRVTQSTYDSMDQLIYQIDPLGRKIRYTWCACGALSALTDGNDNTTSFQYDFHGWLIKKTYPDNSSVQFTYDLLGRVFYRIDALGQYKHYSYNLDNTLSEIDFQYAVNPTPTVNFSWDPNYNRLTEVTNTDPSTSASISDYVYTYNNYITDPFGTPTTGGGMLATLSNSVIPNSTVGFTYDALGRTTNRQINGDANSVTWTYDAMSRLTSESNPLGNFAYAYLDDQPGSSKGTSRLAFINYPNGQTTNFSWYSAKQDERLRGITNVNAAGNMRSQFNYAYDSAGQIIRWVQQNAGFTPMNYVLGYDLAGQLSSAQAGFGSPTNSTASQYFYNYDSGANRAVVQQSTIQTASIGGTATSGDTLTVTVQDAGLPGGQEAVSYSVGSGDTLATIASKIAAAITADARLQVLGVNASSSSNLIKIKSSSIGVTSYAQSTSSGATETITLGVSTNAVQNAIVGLVNAGYASTAGDVLSIAVYDSELSGGTVTVSYTVPSNGTSLSLIAAGLASAVNVNSSLSTLGVSASSASRVVSISSASPNVTTYKSTVTPNAGGGTETVTFGSNTVGNITATLGGAVTTGDIVSLVVRAGALAGGQEAVVYRVPSAATFSSIASGLASVINGDSALVALGASASASGAVVTITTSPTYSKSTSSGSTETITMGTNTNGSVSATIGGTVTVGDTLTLTTNGAGLPTPQNASYTVRSGDSLTSIAAGLAAAVDALPPLQEIRVGASATNAVVKVEYAPVNYPAYITSITNGATETLSMFMNSNGNQRAVVGGSVTAGDTVQMTVYDCGLMGGQETASYTVVSGDSLSSVAAGLKSAINSDANLQALGVSALSSGAAITVSSLSPNVTSYLPAASSGATESIVLRTNQNGTQTAVLNGSMVTSGDVLSLIVYDAGLSGGKETISYTVASGNTLADIASGLASAVNGDSNLSAIGVTASAVSRVVNLSSTSLNATTYTTSASNGASESVVIGASTGAVEEVCNNLNQLVGRRPGGDVRIHGVTNKAIKSASAVLITPFISFLFEGNRGNNPYPTYVASTNSGATEQVVNSVDINGNGRITLVGTPTAGDAVTLTTSYASLSDGQLAFTYTVQSGDTLSTVATALSNLVNANSTLTAAGITSTTSDTTTAVLNSSRHFVVNPLLTSNMNMVSVSAIDGGNNTTTNLSQVLVQNSTSYTASTSVGATENITIAQGPNGSTTITIGGTITSGDTLTVNLSSPVLSQGSAPASYIVQSGDTLTTVASGIASAIKALSVGPVPTVNGAVITLQSMVGPTITFDATGNMLTDGVNSYVWDAENRLIRINYPGNGNNSQFSYDAFGHNVKIIEVVDGTITSTKQFVQDGIDRAEARDSTGAVSAQYFTLGQSSGAANYFYQVTDRGDIAGVTDSSGSVLSSIAYDPYGRFTVLSGSFVSDFGFTGLYLHQRSGMNLAVYRTYNPALGRWLSRDPIWETGGINLYDYVLNEPLGQKDLTGLAPPPWPIVPTPQGRYCNIQQHEQECAKLTAVILAAMADVKNETNILLEDWRDLYTYARWHPNPSVTGTDTTFMGHVVKIDNLKNGLDNAIKDAVKAGCAVPPGARQVADSITPWRPNPKQKP